MSINNHFKSRHLKKIEKSFDYLFIYIYLYLYFNFFFSSRNRNTKKFISTFPRFFSTPAGRWILTLFYFFYLSKSARGRNVRRATRVSIIILTLRATCNPLSAVFFFSLFHFMRSDASPPKNPQDISIYLSLSTLAQWIFSIFPRRKKKKTICLSLRNLSRANGSILDSGVIP